MAAIFSASTWLIIISCWRLVFMLCGEAGAAGAVRHTDGSSAARHGTTASGASPEPVHVSVAGCVSTDMAGESGGISSKCISGHCSMLLRPEPAHTPCLPPCLAPTCDSSSRLPLRLVTLRWKCSAPSLLLIWGGEGQGQAVSRLQQAAGGDMEDCDGPWKQ